MIDTHAHLNKKYFPEIESIVEKCKESGLSSVVLASSNISDSLEAIELSKKYPDFLFPSVGIHPQKTDPENTDSIESQFEQIKLIVDVNQNSIVALGETGLDFSPAPPGEGNRTKEEQIFLFENFIKLSIEKKLPLIIHARKAVDEVIEILSGYSGLKGVFHCYAGGKKRIQKIFDLKGEYYFGFDGNLTYDEGIQSIVPLIPIEKILIETDTPYLAPVPHRGETNYPYYLPFILQKINEILNKDVSETIKKNSTELFRL